MLVFRQLLDATSPPYVYLLGDSHSGEALILDPVLEQVRANPPRYSVPTKSPRVFDYFWSAHRAC